MKQPHIHAEVIKAWAEGAQIQEFENGVWVDLTNAYPAWYNNVQYRVKPEIEYPKTRMSTEVLREVYRPSQTVEQGLLDVANAVIKQAVIDGDVIINPEKV